MTQVGTWRTITLGVSGVAAVGGGILWMQSPLGLFTVPPLVFTSLAALWLSAHPEPPRKSGLLALILALGANMFVAASSIGLFTLPAGTAIRPMAWAALCITTGLSCILCVLVLALHAAVWERGYLWAGLSVPLAVESLFLGFQLMRLAASMKGLIIAD